MSGSNVMTLKRINRELADCQKEDMGAMTLHPENDLFNWKATIPGPEGSPYEGGVFSLKIELPRDYPFSAPSIMFQTRIYHMNISDRGSVCIDILKNNWSPALSLFKVLLSLSSLLTDPNPKDPLVPQIASEYRRDRQKHDRNARHWTQLYARPPPPTSLPVAVKPHIPGVIPSTSSTPTPHAVPTQRAMPAPFPVITVRSQLHSSQNNRATRRTNVAAPSTTPVVIDLSESESPMPTTSAPRSRKRGRDAASEATDVLDLDSGSDEEVRRLVGGSEPSGARSGSGSGTLKRMRTGREGSSRTDSARIPAGDIIVIED